MAAIFTLSSFPGGEQEMLGYTFEVTPKVGNFLHVPAYFVLGTCWKVGLTAWGVRGRKGSWLAVIYSTVFGALDEIHQYFVPERCMDYKDAITNFLGALLAILAWPLVGRLFFSDGPTR
jgi:VanZ family protein